MKTSSVSRTRSVKAKSARDVARSLGLSDKDSAAMELRVAVVKKIIAEVAKQEFTHAQAAELTGTSRSRITSILNGVVQDVSTDLLLRVLSALGIKATVSFAKVA